MLFRAVIFVPVRAGNFHEMPGDVEVQNDGEALLGSWGGVLGHLHNPK